MQEFEERWSELQINSVNNLIVNQIEITPNPTSRKIDIESDLEIVKVAVFSLEGKLLFETSSLTINLFSEGMYLIQIDTKQGSVIKRVVVNKN